MGGPSPCHCETGWVRMRFVERVKDSMSLGERTEFLRWDGERDMG